MGAALPGVVSGPTPLTLLEHLLGGPEGVYRRQNPA